MIYSPEAYGSGAPGAGGSTIFSLFVIVVRLTSICFGSFILLLFVKCFWKIGLVGRNLMERLLLFPALMEKR